MRQLAETLRNAGGQVLLDLEQESRIGRRLADDEWRRWMRGCLDEADRVLCLTTAYYVGLAAPSSVLQDRGRGVALECSEFDDRIYVSKQRNEGWIWLCLLDGTSDQGAAVPRFLKGRCPVYSVPSDTDLLVSDIVRPLGASAFAASLFESHSASAPPARANSPEAEALDADDRLLMQKEHLAAALRAAPKFWAALRGERWFYGSPPRSHAPAALKVGDIEAFVAELARVNPDGAHAAMFAAQRSLKASRETGLEREAVQTAAVALFCLAACRLVKVDALVEAGGALTLSSHANVYCAVVSTALFGGKIELADSENPRLPRHRHAYEVELSAAGDHAPFALERAAFGAICAECPEAYEIELDTGPLPDAAVELLREAIEQIRYSDLANLTLVVRSPCPAETAREFHRQYQVPVVLISDAVAAHLIGMTVGQFVERFRYMWEVVRSGTGGAATDAVPPPRSSASGGSTMKEGNAPMSIQANTVFVTQANAPGAIAQSGEGNSLSVTHGGVDGSAQARWQELTAQVNELAQLIKDASRETAADLEPKVREALLVLEKGPKSEPGRLRALLGDIKKAGDAADGGAKLAELSGKAIALLLSLLGG